MANTTIESETVPARMSLPARFIGIITAPKATFQAVVAHPKLLGMLAVTTLIMAMFSALPMMTEGGRQAALDVQVRQMESFGMQVNDQMYQQMQSRMGIAAYTTAGGVVVMAPIISVALTGLLFAIFNAAMGGTATFKQLFTVYVHATVISATAQIFTGTLNYFRGSMSSATNLAVALPMFDEGSFVARLAGMVDLFVIWWLIVLAIGLGVLYRRRTQPIAVTLFSIYAVIALAAAAIMSRFGGTN